jgi:hypothetical protein
VYSSWSKGDQLVLSVCHVVEAGKDVQLGQVKLDPPSTIDGVLHGSFKLKVPPTPISSLLFALS